MKNLRTMRLACMLVVSFAMTDISAQTPLQLEKPASAATIAAQARVAASLPSDNGQDEEFARRGFIATPEEKLVRGADGHVVWETGQFDWARGEAPPTVNPSLWRQVKLLSHHGLFKVTDGVWQLRGFDPANMTIVSGRTGWIVIDPMMSTETAGAAMKFIKEQLGERPVSAVIYGHSHADHFGGARAVVTPGTNPPIYAPEGLVRETIAEHVLAGNAMSRRISYQFAMPVKPGPTGYIGTGITQNTPLQGTVSLLPPTDEIKRTGETGVIDGVTFEFQLVPETEAPAEMNFFLPAQKTLYVSEDTTCTMHNLQTPRGALVRDGLKWAGYITEQIGMWGDKVDSLVTGHCWPRFGNETIRNYLTLQRDNYKFIHDQTVRRMNMGETPLEIAEELKRPAAIENEWSNRGYYGTVRHNAKGVYQRYMGWWDGIPAHLNLYPPVEQGKRFVRAMGGAKNVIREARRAMNEGDYRWSADILNNLVFAEPDDQRAKALLADSYEQMGYQSESAVWRNIYLTGAAELRGAKSTHMVVSGPDLARAMSMASLLDLMATRLNPDKIGDRAMTMVVDDGVGANKSLVTVRNAVLVGEVGRSIAAPTVSVSGDRMQLTGLFLGKMPLDKLETAGLRVNGDRTALLALLDAIEAPPPDYPIVTP